MAKYQKDQIRLFLSSPNFKKMRINFICFVVVTLFTTTLSAQSKVLKWYEGQNITPPSPTVKYDEYIPNLSKKIDLEALIYTINYQVNNEIQCWDKQLINNITKLLYTKELTIELSEKARQSNIYSKHQIEDNKIIIPGVTIKNINNSIDYNSLSKNLIISMLELSNQKHKVYQDNKIENLISLLNNSYIETTLNEPTEMFKELKLYADKNNRLGESKAFIGEWKTDYGHMNLDIAQSSLSNSKNINELYLTQYQGYYNKVSDQKKIEGTLKNTNGSIKLNGVWSNQRNNRSMPISFTLAEDMQSFTGYWLNEEGREIPWNGTKIITDKEKIFGTWLSNDDKLIIQPGANGYVFGEFGLSTKKFEGVINKDNNQELYIIEGQWLDKNSNEVLGYVEISFDPEDSDELIFKRNRTSNFNKWDEFKCTRK